jgi:hypothetical protein
MKAVVVQKLSGLPGLAFTEVPDLASDGEGTWCNKFPHKG